MEDNQQKQRTLDDSTAPRVVYNPTPHTCPPREKKTAKEKKRKYVSLPAPSISAHIVVYRLCQNKQSENRPEYAATAFTTRNETRLESLCHRNKSHHRTAISNPTQ